MTLEELKEALKRLKDEGESDDDMRAVFYAMYVDGDIKLEELGTIIDVMGYEFTPEFEAMSEEYKNTKGWDNP